MALKTFGGRWASFGTPLGVALGLALGASAARADDAAAAPTAAASGPLAQAGGKVMVDYQSIRLDGFRPIDLIGFHFLNRFNDWLYAGVGGHAPLFQGEYGGFMVFDGTLHAERALFGPVSAMAGISLGGGGGGRSVAQSKLVSGTGGFVKAYAGLGYRFGNDMTVGLTYSKIRLTHSAIDGSQFGLAVQTPFSYTAAPYADAGQRVRRGDAGTSASRDEDVVTFGVDNIVQIKPKGTFTGTVNLVDAQYSHFFTDDAYVLFGGSVGYHGLAAYNQAFGGLGLRFPVAPRVNLQAQLAVGSGGYAPEKIDTGSGLLIFPKVSAEYRVSRNLGLMLSGGYLYAPRGSSRNVTLGASLAYHLSPGGVPGDAAGDAPGDGATLTAQRFHLFPQTEFQRKVGDREQGQIRLLTLQVDTAIRGNVYVPLQGSVAYDSYLGYPGYGEVLAGLGVQSGFARGDRFQTFAQFLVGTNVHGLIVKPAVGVDVSLSDRLALYGQAGATVSLDGVAGYPRQYRFRSGYVGVGLTYRFSLPQG